MKQPTYEELYGCTLDEYAAYHGTTIEQMMEKTQNDIRLLEINYQRYAQRNHELNDRELFVAMQIKKLIKKKEAHLNRLRKWKG